MNNKLTAVSLFCSSGIGDIALSEAGVDVLVANELISERAELFKCNFPETKMIVGDIWEAESEIVLSAQEALDGRELDLLFATPPCQGMSKNGRGKLLNAIRKGDKPKHDERNRLVIPAMNIAKALRPRYLVMENVPEMKNTVITENGNPEDVIFIMDYISKVLGKEYSGSWEVVQFADYGVPQRRQRLITVFSRDSFATEYMEKFGTALPPRSHSSQVDSKLKPWETVRTAVANLPELDGRSKENATSRDLPYHRVPLLDKEKYFWVSNTPEERGAFDNQCVNPKCGYQNNPTHSARRGSDGINRARSDTPLYCEKCKSLLPRPTVRVGNELRLMKGYTSAYKRMNWDLPSSTLTRNLSYACSDNKLHPCQNRVLSLHEAMILHTISDFSFEWKRADGKRVSDKLIRESIGESIPPRGLKVIFDHIARLASSDDEVLEKPKRSQMKLL